jgi:hypothetical protein
MGGPDLNSFILLITAAAIAAMPQIFVREKFPMPSYLISAGGGVQLLSLAWRWQKFIELRLPHTLLTTISVGLVVAGIVWLLDLRFLTEHRMVDRSELFLPGFIGFFVVGYLLLALFSHRSEYTHGVEREATCVAMLLLLAGWVWFRRRYIALHWVLQRRPEAVCWVFVQSTRVTRNGVFQGTFWSTQVGLEDGQLLALSTNQQAAEQIAAEVAHVCPQAAIGYADATRAQFAKDPKSVRRTALPPPA